MAFNDFRVHLSCLGGWLLKDSSWASQMYRWWDEPCYSFCRKISNKFYSVPPYPENNIFSSCPSCVSLLSSDYQRGQHTGVCHEGPGVSLGNELVTVFPTVDTHVLSFFHSVFPAHLPTTIKSALYVQKSHGNWLLSMYTHSRNLLSPLQTSCRLYTSSRLG